MKKSELRQMIREEISKVRSERVLSEGIMDKVKSAIEPYVLRLGDAGVKLALKTMVKLAETNPEFALNMKTKALIAIRHANAAISDDSGAGADAHLSSLKDMAKKAPSDMKPKDGMQMGFVFASIIYDMVKNGKWDVKLGAELSKIMKLK